MTDTGRKLDAMAAPGSSYCVENGPASALYEGTLRHRRLEAVDHAFSYRVLMAYLDLAELPEALDVHPLWSARHRAPVEFRRSDFHGARAIPLDVAVRDTIEARTGTRPHGPVRLLAHLRTWGWAFNPIAFYLAFDETGERIETLMAEVTNTPWHERTAYVLEVPSESALAIDGIRFPKAMHVSPFMDMDVDHVVRMTRPSADWTIRMDDWRGNDQVFAADLDLRRLGLDRPTMGAALRHHPLPAQRVSGGIYWEALKLRAKGAPFRRHPERHGCRQPTEPEAVAASSRPPQEITVFSTTSPSDHAASICPIEVRPVPIDVTAADRVARTVLRQLLTRLDHGRLTVIEHDGTTTAYGRPTDLDVTVRLQTPAMWREVVTKASAGLGESYLDGWWDTDDLTSFVQLVIRNLGPLDRLRSRWARLNAPVSDVARRTRRPDKHRDKRNIAAHYDLGNDFFSLFLDPTMAYSCGLFRNSEVSLEEAQRAKFERLCRLLRLTPHDHLLEIGTGWGGLAVYAAESYGCRVTTTTISEQQHSHAAALVAERGLSDQVTLLTQDYRDLTGTYDKIVSVEMIEAVDWRDHDDFFRVCSHLLQPEGLMALQAIVVPDQRFERAKTSKDFIKRFIFPGACLPSVGAINTACTRATDLSMVRLDEFPQHYAETLFRWRENLAKREDDARALGYDDAFLRLWKFYLCYCEAAYRERYVSLVEVVLAKPGWRSDEMSELIGP